MLLRFLRYVKSNGSFLRLEPDVDGVLISSSDEPEIVFGVQRLFTRRNGTRFHSSISDQPVHPPKDLQRISNGFTGSDTLVTYFSNRVRVFRCK